MKSYRDILNSLKDGTGHLLTAASDKASDLLNQNWNEIILSGGVTLGTWFCQAMYSYSAFESNCDFMQSHPMSLAREISSRTCTSWEPPSMNFALAFGATVFMAGVAARKLHQQPSNMQPNQMETENRNRPANQ